MCEIDLGFPEIRETGWLTNRYFPSKVGGKPSWLELQKLPSQKQLQCKDCGLQKTFLCQIYAPYEDHHNFHRTIFVFVCRTESCQKPNAINTVTALRSQLPRENEFYSSEAPKEDGLPLDSIPSPVKLCIACGCIGPLSCGRCKSAHYCCAEHQRAHWSYHKKICSQECTETQQKEVNNVILPKILIPEWEIVIESNENESNAPEKPENDDAKEREQIAEYEKLVADGKAGVLKDIPDSELTNYTQNTEDLDDKYFRKFKKTISTNPDQILRYKRNGCPLWIADVEKSIKSQLDIPNCEYCHGPRQFEFQIMPQMLLLLKDEQQDWGVLAIYTCASSCKPSNEIGYLQEYVIKQDII